MENDAPQEYVKKPYSEQEMQHKIDKIRKDIGQKMGAWSTRVQVSMSHAPKVQRVEGETWKEDGKDYIFKGGIKQTVSLMQDARMPIWCPKCSIPMNHRFDRKFYYIRGWCFNCNVEWEGALRLSGEWDAYEQRIVRENEKAFLRDKIQEHVSYIEGFTVPTVYFENGGYERIGHISHYEDLFANMNADIEFMIARLEHIRRDEEHESSIAAVVESV